MSTATTAVEQHQRPSGPATRRKPLRRLTPLLIAATVVAVLAIGYQLLAAPRWDVVWSDDFDGASGSAPSARNWILSTGTSYPGGAPQWGTGEIQTYTRDSENVRLDGEGNLVITATRDAAGAWRSARLESARSDFQPPPGGALEVSARLKLPDGGRGYWGAFWMLGKDFRGNYTNWPGVGEIDIMEYIGRQPSSVFGTLHCGTAPGGPCGEPNGIGGGHTQPDGSALSDVFHTFSIQWDRSGSTEQIRWYLDGERFFTVNADDVDAATWKQATDHGFFVLLNLAIGGGWPGPPDDSTRPGASMIVDRVWVSQA